MSVSKEGSHSFPSCFLRAGLGRRKQKSVMLQYAHISAHIMPHLPLVACLLLLKKQIQEARGAVGEQRPSKCLMLASLAWGQSMHSLLPKLHDPLNVLSSLLCPMSAVLGAKVKLCVYHRSTAPSELSQHHAHSLQHTKNT